MPDPAPYQIETQVDPLTNQTVVAVTAFSGNSQQYRATFVSTAPQPAAANPQVQIESTNVAPIVQAAAASATVPPGDLAPWMVPTPLGDPSAAQDIIDAITVADAATPSATNA